MSLFAIADLHLSLGSNKPMGKFKGWFNHVKRLEDNWNEVVGEDDTVVIAGDVSWGSTLEQAHSDFEFIHRYLKGDKIILKGNHDHWWATGSKLGRFFDENGFDSLKILHKNAFLVDGVSVCGSRGWISDSTEQYDRRILFREANRLDASLKDGVEKGGELVVFLHYPPVYDYDENVYITDVLKRYGIKRCFYGHIHSGIPALSDGNKDGVQYSMITADYLDFTPLRVV